MLFFALHLRVTNLRCTRPIAQSKLFQKELVSPSSDAEECMLLDDSSLGALSYCHFAADTHRSVDRNQPAIDRRSGERTRRPGI